MVRKMSTLSRTSVPSNSLEKLYFERLRHRNNISGSNLDTDPIKSIASGTHCRANCNILPLKSVRNEWQIEWHIGHFFEQILDFNKSQKILKISDKIVGNICCFLGKFYLFQWKRHKIRRERDWIRLYESKKFSSECHVYLIVLH